MSKGSKTKKHLYNCAKHLFYKNGYNNTSIKDIVHFADSSLGVFTYHFDSKELLAYDIYQEITYDIFLNVEKAFDELKLDISPLIIDAIEYRYYFELFFSNENAKKLYLDLYNTACFHLKAKEMNKKIINNCLMLISDLRKDDQISYYSNENISTIMTGMETRYTYDCLMGIIDCSDLDKTIDFIIYHYYKYLINDEEQLQLLVENSKEYSKKIRIVMGNDFKIKTL